MDLSNKKYLVDFFMYKGTGKTYTSIGFKYLEDISIVVIVKNLEI